MRVNNKGYIMENLTYKVTYPDGDVEYWAGEGNPTITDEIIRLEKLYDRTGRLPLSMSLMQLQVRTVSLCVFFRIRRYVLRRKNMSSGCMI